MTTRIQYFLLTTALILTSISYAQSTDYQNPDGINEQQNIEEKVHIKGKNSGKRKRAHFNKLDLNTDGNISWEEFQQHKKPRNKRERIFQRIDANNDGSISQQEFREHKPTHYKKRDGRKLEVTSEDPS